MEKQCKGFAYMEKSNKPYVLYGDTEKEILDKLSGWNRSRTADMQYSYCNIGTFDPGMEKYARYQKYDVASGKNISALELKIPSQSNEEFQKTIQEFKGKGAKYNSLYKKWYVSPDNPNMDYFKPFIVDKTQEASREEKADLTEKLEQQTGKGLAEKPDSQQELLNLTHKVMQIDVEEMHLADEKLAAMQSMVDKDMELNGKLSDMTKDVLNVLHATVDEGVIPTEDGKILKREHQVRYQQQWLDAQNTRQSVPVVEEQVSKQQETSAFGENREEQISRAEEPKYQVGDQIDAYQPKMIVLPNDPEKFFISGISHVQGTVEEIYRNETGDDVCMLKEPQGYIQHVAIKDIYMPAQTAVLLRAVEDKLRPEQFSLVADPGFSGAQMEAVRQSFKDGLSMDQVRSFAVPEMDAWQMELCRYGLQNGLKIEALHGICSQPGKDWIQGMDDVNTIISGKRQSRIDEIRAQGFQADMKLVKTMERLDHLTGHENSLKDICKAFKEGSYKDSPAGDIVDTLAKEFQCQELQQNNLLESIEPEPVM